MTTSTYGQQEESPPETSDEGAAPDAAEQVQTESGEVEEMVPAPSPELKSERVQRQAESGATEAEETS